MITIWFALVVLCWVLFFVLEGFDFGVGLLAPALGRDEHERGAVISTVGPFWDGNEVWLVAAIGVTFAAFPSWYAAELSGLYLPMVLILLIAWTVDRLIKLKVTISKIKTAIQDKSRTLSILPDSKPPGRSECKCTLVNGSRDKAYWLPSRFMAGMLCRLLRSAPGFIRR